MTRFRRTATRLALALAASAAMFAADAAGSFFRPLRAVVPPVIDGRLDDAVWRDAP
jgi:hypothetical protein